MSKSIPDSAIFITDSPEEIMRKINKAFCPEKEIQFNPILDWTKSIILRDDISELTIKRSEKFGGNKTYKRYNELEKDFAQGKLHPLDLKKAVAEKIIEILKPAREHFEKPNLKRMVKEMENLIVTR